MPELLPELYALDTWSWMLNPFTCLSSWLRELIGLLLMLGSRGDGDCNRTFGDCSLGLGDFNLGDCNLATGEGCLGDLCESAINLGLEF